MPDYTTHPGYAPRRAEGGLPVRAVILAMCGALGLISLVLLVLIIAPRLDPLDRAARADQRYRDARISEQLEGLDVALAAAWRLLPLLVVGSGAALSFGIAWRQYGEREAVRARLVIAAQRAAHGPVPQTLTYSPHFANRQDIQGAAPEALPAPAGDVPSFAQLLDRGRIGAGRPLLLGFDIDTGAELSGSWLDLYSTAVGGMPGSGKTTSQRFLACQTALMGARFAVIDPHAEAGADSLASTLDPLRGAFIAEPASSDRQILDLARLVAETGRRRVEGKDRDQTPVILWVDELTALLGRSSVADALAELLEKVAQEYRKKSVFVCASGQIWTAARTTSELRDSFASVIAHRMKRSQARMLVPTEEAETVERLPVGRAVLWRTSGATSTIAIPLTTAGDVIRVGQQLGGGAATVRLPHMPDSSHFVAGSWPIDMPDRSRTVAEGEPEGVRLQTAPGSAEAARALALFREGRDMAQIVADLRGIRSNQGARYQEALREVQALMRQALG